MGDEGGCTDGDMECLAFFAVGGLQVTAFSNKLLQAEPTQQECHFTNKQARKLCIAVLTSKQQS